MSEPLGMPWRGESPPIQADGAAQSAHRYRVIDKLESGGMAEVFRAESTGLEGFRKQVAIKRVLPHLGRNLKFISMFLDEARPSAQLSHSNCVQVFDIGVLEPSEPGVAPSQRRRVALGIVVLLALAAAALAWFTVR